MSITNYPKCRTCRHWHPDLYGFCGRIPDEDDFEVGVLAFTSPCYDFGSSLRTHPDFGCLLHSEIEIDQQKGEG